MSQLDKMQVLLNNTVSDDKRRLPSIVNPPSDYPLNSILIFELPGGEPLKLGRFVQIGKYRLFIQVAIQHNDYDKARLVSFRVMELLGTKDAAGLVMIPQNTPVFAGLQGQKGSYLFTIDYLVKGDN